MTVLTTPLSTHLRKTDGGWKATTTLILDEKTADGKALELDITTRKYGHKLVTRASVSAIDGAFRTHVVYQDYSKRVAENVARCTEKNVALQHVDVLASFLSDILAECTKQYAVAEAA